MRKLILILLLFLSAVVNGQTPAGILKRICGLVDAGILIQPTRSGYNGTSSYIRNGAWVGDGAVAMVGE